MNLEDNTSLFSKYLWCWVCYGWLIVGLFFEWQDTRELADFGNYYRSLPDWLNYYDQVEGPLTLIDLLRPFGGWYVGLLAGLNWIGIPLRLVFVIMGAFWLGLLCWSLRYVPKWSLLLLMGMPIWPIAWHSNWLHLVETALLCVLWQVPISLSAQKITNISWSQSVLVVVLGMLSIALRPSALIWLGLLCFFWVAILKIRGNLSWSLGLGVLLGILWIRPELLNYIQGKFHVPPIEFSIIDEILRHTSLWVLGFASIGSLLLLQYWDRRYWFWFLALLVMFGLSLFFGVGLDNFLLGYVALAMLGGGGLQLRWSFQSWGWLGFLIAFLSITASVLPSKIASYAVWWTHPDIERAHSYNFLRPFDEALQLKEIEPYLREICKDIGSKDKCLVLSAHPLFHPHRESEGHLALVQAGYRQWDLRNSELLWLGNRRHSLPRHLNGVIVNECRMDNHSAEPFLRNANNFMEWVRAQSKEEMTFVGTLPKNGCLMYFYHWNAKGGNQK